MGSTRLPGKILLPLRGEPILGFLVKNLSSFRIPLVVATTIDQSDDVVQELAAKLGVPVFRGSEEDVLDRYVQASRLVSCDAVVRVTADCPLLDPSLLQAVVDAFYDHQVDYVSNTIERTFPRGYDVEVISKKALERAWNEARLPCEREHVTLYVVEHVELFSRYQVVDTVDRSSWRLTVDTEEDYRLVSMVAEACQDDISYLNVVQILKQHPEWKLINEHIRQKKVR
jgi:spore coat polysaccharide biosynthesis protein SpsF